VKTLLYIVLVLLFGLSVLLKRATYSLSLKEYKRRARAQDTTAARLHKVAAYGPIASLVLWLITVASLSTLVISASHYSWWLSWLIIAAAVWLLWSGKELKNYGSWQWRLASLLAPPLSRLSSYLQPALGRFLTRPLPVKHTGAYDKEDLLALIKRQHNQSDNRVSDDDLKLALNVLQSGDKTVGQIMKPRRSVKWVGQDEPIGPLLMDELHASGLSSFPVVQDTSRKTPAPEVIGTLYLADLMDQSAGGKIRDVFRRDVYFINEGDSIHDALAAFTKTHHHLLIVVNNFEEVVGVLTFELVIESLLGIKITTEFDRYGDRKAVAGRRSETEQPKKP